MQAYSACAMLRAAMAEDKNVKTKPRIVICDDEELIRWSLGEHLTAEGFEVGLAQNGEECLKQAMETAPDLIILDLKMPVLDGLGCLRKMREHGLDLPVIVLTAFGAIETAIEATQLGAAAYLIKPFDLREVTLQIQRTLSNERLSHEVSYLREKERARYGNLVGDSAAMRSVFEMLRRLEGIDGPTVLITGESGTGKELVALAIHNQGPRKDAPFVEIDCASLPETLIESELFGHERGAFTDARQQKRGLFEVARGGTVFLDEIGEMPITTQAKLLRALESRRVKRVGGVTDIQIDAGIIAATNRDLAKEVENGRFRRDLFYRLAVIPIELPPLRARGGDVAQLVAHFLEVFTKRIPGQLKGVSAPAMEALTRYAWPGNVREVKNVMERIVTLFRDEPQIELAHLPPEIRFAAPQQVVTTTGSSRFVLPPEGVDLDAVERDFVVQALERTENNQTAAAKLLGLSRYALRNRMEKYGLK